MRFLIVTKSRQAIPMEAAVMLVEGMREWARKYTANKKMEQVWGFAGLPGGGGILNVTSIEELDAVMAEFPFTHFSDIQIYALTDLDKALTNGLNAFKKMMPSR